MTDGEISIDDPRAPDVSRLLEVHLAFARAPTPPEDAHALEVDELLDPSVKFFSLRRGGKLLAVGALKRLDREHAEVKSMHTAQDVRGQGIGRRMLEHLVDVARADGYRRVSLETGSMAEFAPARSLYASAGFEPCQPFGDYRLSPNSTYMTLRLPRRPEEVAVRALGRTLAIRVWSPAEGTLPLLIVHDGPEYDTLAALTRYAEAAVERGAIAPFRVALLPPGDRDEWYSASALYGRALCNRILPVLREHVAVAARPVGMGASLGALAMLHAQRAWPDTFAGLFLQSGSFFVPRFDRHESRFPRYGRIVRFVRSVLRSSRHEDTVPVTMTCGANEENIHNNRLVADALAGQGYVTNLAEVSGAHNFEGWRGALDPHLTRLLANLWPAP